MLKMAQEIARKVGEEKARNRSRSPRSEENSKDSQRLFESEDIMEAPPAYVA
jgi:hypothetical protein